MAEKIIIDCDPGIDDALAIAFAVGSPDLDLCGITTVAGNVGLDLTTSNAQRVCEVRGRPGRPGHPGQLGIRRRGRRSTPGTCTGIPVSAVRGCRPRKHGPRADTPLIS